MNDNNQNLDNMFAEERKRAIVEYLQKNKKTTVAQLCDFFNVSSATIRNDLKFLESNGLLQRTHGGAISNVKAKYEQTSHQKKVENIEAKNAIAKKALDYVDDGDTIAIDTGTTTLCFARLLVKKKDLTIVTNDIEIASLLEEETEFNIILIGGNLRRGFHCNVGPIALRCLEDLCVDRSFIATNSINIENGLTTPSLELAEIKKKIMNISREKILLCDKKKFGKASFAKFADIKDIDTIITDEGISKEVENELTQQDVEVDIVSV